ncbi:SUN domain-containing protein 1 isoform X2 [Mixophyes fleayi]|uniref:SUN domain-containing protein 1 isoform X2 n=1 Tax=Mixophyes fleayi TaxID=3061075 RepID=UPI003F4D83AC
MDYSHLHTYAPPQCLPENTGYTYALSSSYSSAALDFENLHKLDPVFDSPRMSRRSLRLTTATTGFSDDFHNDSIGSNVSYSGSISHDRSLNRSVRQQHNSSRQSSSSSRHSASRKAVSNASFHSSFSTHASDASMLSSVLDESSIREQTEVGHLWGLDEDDPKAGDATVIQANGDVLTAETQTTLINGYTCSDCSMLSERSNVLTAFSASRAPDVSTYTTSSKVYSRDRIQKHKSRELPVSTHKTMLVVRSAVSSLTALLMKLFHMIMLKLGCEQKAHSNFCGSMNVTDYQTEDGHLRVNGESLCYFLMQAVRSVGSAGWFVSRKVLSFLWLAIVSPGKAASGMFWWLGTGWYQLSTLISLLNVFFLTRCLPKVFRLLLFLIPLLLLLGLWLWGFDALLAMLSIFRGIGTHTTQTTEDPIPTIPSLKPTSDIHISSLDKKESGLQFDVRMKELEKKFGLMADHQNHHEEDYNKLRLLVGDIHEQIGHVNQGHMSTIIASLLDERFAKMKMGSQEKPTGEDSISRDHETRILRLEALLDKLSEAIEEDRKRAQSATSEDEIQDQSLLRRRIDSLAQEFEEYKAAFLKDQTAKSSCDLADCVLQKVDTKVRDTIQMMFRSQGNLPESFLQWVSANYVSNGDFNTRLQELELRILKNITHQVSIKKKMSTSKIVEGAVTGGISGITEEEAQVLVNNALKLYSQDRTGMVDFALESGGGSVLGTRCSETYETKTALVSLFGIPLWYLSQSPRVVIQPDMYPGNCWAFKGTQGYLVVRLSMVIYPTAFSLEHIPKSLSPTGNITSAPKDFAVYGLEDEYEEDGVLLIQSVYDEAGEPLQIFFVTEENKKTFQIVELRILSNWGHTDYTCLYRFRAHGTPVK